MRKRYFEKTYKRKDLRKVIAVYAQPVDVVAEPFVQRYDLFDDGVYVDSVAPSALSSKVVDDFLNNGVV